MTPLEDTGEDVEYKAWTHNRRHSSPASVFLQYSGLGALIMLGIAWGMLSARTNSNTDEIRELRTMNIMRAQQDVITAREMATKTDIREINAKLDLIQTSVTRK